MTTNLIGNSIASFSEAQIQFNFVVAVWCCQFGCYSSQAQKSDLIGSIRFALVLLRSLLPPLYAFERNQETEIYSSSLMAKN